MSKKKAAKAKAARGTRNLPPKTLTTKQARSVKGGRIINTRNVSGPIPTITTPVKA